MVSKMENPAKIKRMHRHPPCGDSPSTPVARAVVPSPSSIQETAPRLVQNRWPKRESHRLAR